MFSRLRSFLTAWTRRERFEDSLDEEVRFHLDAYADDLVRSGVPRREALRHARIHFGSVEGVKDDCRQARGLRLADEIARDTKHAGRFLHRNPGLGLVAIATLGLSIGATVLVFSIVDAWLFRPLTFPEPDRLTISVYATREQPSEPAVFVLYRDYLSWKERSRSFESMSAVFPRTYLMGDVADIGTAEGLVVTGELFRTLGVSPRLGRTFSHGDETGDAVTVLSHGLWERRFGASEAILGTSVTLNDVPHEVVGVMPPEFDLRILDQTTGFELWTLFRPGEPGYTPGGTGGVAVLGRLRSGTSIASARRELTGIHRDSESAYARSAADFDVLVASLQADNTRTVRLTLVVVAGAVGCLLLIACMNIAALWLGRAPGRAREAAIRVALGAGRMRLVGQSLAASLLLACIGGAFRMWLLGGLAFASLLLAAIGVYGIVSQRVAHRMREIGIRLALGAAPGRVRVAVTIRTLVTVAVGAVGGCAAAMVLSSALEAVLYGVGPSDFVSFTAALATLLTVATGAAFAAAWRATRISPVAVLRGN